MDIDMDLDVAELLRTANELHAKLAVFCTKLEETDAENRKRYQNPQYRLWSGKVEDVSNFVERLGEWLSEPDIAEAKRYLGALRRMCAASKEPSIANVEEDWRFLSD